MLCMVQSRALLRAGGCFYVDDFVAIGTLTDTENHILRDDVFCSYLPNLDQYRSELQAAGFTIDVVPIQLNTRFHSTLSSLVYGWVMTYSVNH
jgi:hypothetical protein